MTVTTVEQFYRQMAEIIPVYCGNSDMTDDFYGLADDAFDRDKEAAHSLAMDFAA